MPAERRWRRQWGLVAARLLPATLFGRLAMLQFFAVVSSHVVVLTLLFELGPRFGEPGPSPVLDTLREEAGFSRRSPSSQQQQQQGQQGNPPPDEAGPSSDGPLLEGGLLLDIAIRLAGLLVAAWVGARWLSQPVRRLADAAQELGRDIHSPPLAETGTTECREATRVFNGMQARIQRQIADRDRFVAAVSHDLRTPLTRLRLRAEALQDADERARFGRDIGEMDAMIRSTLDYLLGAAEAEAQVRLDVTALVRSIADDQADAGHAATVSGEAAPLPAQASALRRCIANLVENAIRYGGGAEIFLHDSPRLLRIVVADRGPGLAPAEIDKVLQPFYRVEGSRNRHSGGVGLGLSIAEDIARRHGGSLSLANRPGGGLAAELSLPRA
jgi:signal transduction histidine kinase